tara:strand:+ start:768 stop:1151 length:384 start_codon:yes stop_codon:yes gene_type:complete
MSYDQPRYVVLIEVDPLVVWRQTSKMMELMVGIKPRIEALREREFQRLEKERAEDPQGFRYRRGFSGVLWDRFEAIKRLHSLARWAKANFRIEERDVNLLVSMENGELENWFCNLLSAAEKSEAART